MRKNRQEQLSLQQPWLAQEHAKELEAISALLDENPRLAELATQALVPDGVSAERGRRGMTGEQALRAAIVRQMNGFSYEELAFHLQDSLTYRRFVRLGLGDKPPSASALAANIKRLGPETWEAIHRVVLAEAVRRGVDDGRKVRIDTTPVAAPSTSRMMRRSWGMWSGSSPGP